MRATHPRTSRPPRRGFFWELMTFDRLMTGPIAHLIYWAGLALIALVGCGVIGAAVGLALRDASATSVLLAIPALVGGALAILVMTLLWRGFCEFYLAVFRIADDLAALRRVAEAESARGAAYDDRDAAMRGAVTGTGVEV